MKEAPIESSGATGMVERYHAPLRPAYERFRLDADHHTSKKEFLQLFKFGTSCNIGLESLCLILHTFGVTPRPACTMLAPSQIEREEIIDLSLETVEKE